jgi:hypothetical protein
VLTDLYIHYRNTLYTPSIYFIIMHTTGMLQLRRVFLCYTRWYVMYHSALKASVGFEPETVS